MKQKSCFLQSVVLCIPLTASAQTIPAPKPANGFDLYVWAANSFIAAKPAVDEVDDPEVVRDPKIRAERYSLVRKEAWLKQNAAGFALFKQALKMPTSYPRMPYKARVLWGLGPYGKFRALGRYKLIEARAREMRGDWSGAVQSHLDIVQFGSEVGWGGPMAATLPGIAIEALGRDYIWDITENLTLPQARAAAVRLQNIYDHRVRFVTALKDHKAAGLEELSYVVNQPTWRDPRNWGTLSAAEKARLLTITPSEVRAHYGAAMDRQIQWARAPYRVATPSQARQLSAFEGAASLPNWSRSQFDFACNDAGNALWLVTLALRAHKLERGAYPKTLRGLVPGFLREVPLDPFSGVAPLRYKLDGDSYVLWSIGPDGIDNDGQPVTWRDGQPPAPIPGRAPRLPFPMQDSKGDFVAGKNR